MIAFLGILDFGTYPVVYLTFQAGKLETLVGIATLGLLEALRSITQNRYRFSVKINLLAIQTSLRCQLLKKTFSKSATRQPHSNIKDLQSLMAYSEDCVNFLGESLLLKKQWILKLLLTLAFFSALPYRSMLLAATGAFCVLYLILVSIVSNSTIDWIPQVQQLEKANNLFAQSILRALFYVKARGWEVLIKTKIGLLRE